MRKFLPLFLFLAYSFHPQPAFSEVVLDGTLGASGNINGPNYLITHDMGQQHGSNLFHSFQRFGLNSGESAIFSGPSSIHNIISRVTGGEASFIDGTIKSEISGADFYFINPAGITFGRNATLDINGSFHSSTADYLRLSDNSRFSAKDMASSGITSAPPEAFGFLGDNPAKITVETNHGAAEGSYPDSGLDVQAGKTISLIGGDVEFSHGAVYAPDGKINVGAVKSSGEIGIDGMNTGSFARLGDIALENKSLINATGMGGGEIYIRGENFELDNSGIYIINIGDAQKGSVDILARENFLIRNQSVMTTPSIGPGSAADISVSSKNIAVRDSSILGSYSLTSGGDVGTVNLDAENVELSSGGKIINATGGNGQGGDININAENSLSISGSQMYAATSGSGNSGSLNISSHLVDIKNGSSVYINSAGGSGNGGKIGISSDILTMSGGSKINGNTTGSGKGGQIDINSRKIDISGASAITSGTSGTGNAGDIRIKAPESFSLSSSDLTVSSMAEGNGGTVLIDSPLVAISDGSRIALKSMWSGNGGSIEFLCDKMNMGSGSKISAYTDYLGAGGDVRIAAGDFSVTGGAQINADISGSGDGGDINIFASRSVGVSGINSAISLNSYYGATGNSGDLHIKAPVMSFLDGAQILASTVGGGNAGNIFMEADKFSLIGGANIATSSFGGGKPGIITIDSDESLVISGSDLFCSNDSIFEGGLIRLSAPDISIIKGATVEGSTSLSGTASDIKITGERIRLEGGSINSSTVGSGKGGSISIEAGESLILSTDRTVDQGNISYTDSKITAFSTSEGDAGKIDINTSELNIDASSYITASTIYKGNGGDIRIKTSKLDLEGFISADTGGSGKGGNIDIDAAQVDVHDGGSISSLVQGKPIVEPQAGIDNTEVAGIGEGGNIKIQASESFSVHGVDSKGGQSLISTSTLGSGHGGDIFIYAPDTKIYDDGFVTCGTAAEYLNSGGGNAGVIDITASRLFLDSGAQINGVSWKGSGTAGDIRINASESVILSGSSPRNNGILTQIRSDSKDVGDGGKIEINTPLLSLSDNALVNVKAISSGNSGVIDINASEINLSGRSAITAQSEGSGESRSINISTRSLSLENSAITLSTTTSGGGDLSIICSEIAHLLRSRITTSVAGGFGDGGNISFTGSRYTILNDSQIIAQAYEGRGGNINIQSGQFVKTPESLVDASSRLGIDGEVSVNAPEQDISSAIIKIRDDFMDAGDLIRDPCQLRKQGVVSAMTTGLRGGLPFDFSFPYSFFTGRYSETNEKRGGKSLK